MALEGIKTAIEKDIHERFEDLKKTPKIMVNNTIGGILDATFMNAGRTLGDILKGPLPELTQGIIQPAARAGLAVKEAITLHPGKALVQTALGIEKLAEHGVRLVSTGVETIANTINRLLRGTARTVAGVVGENIFGDRYKDVTAIEEKLEIPVVIGVEAVSTGKPAGEKPLFGPAPAATSPAEH